MKKGGLVVLLLGVMLFMSFLSTRASAADPQCDLTMTLLNQDPYPAVPGEYVKVVFQLNGIEGNECGKVSFDLTPEFPFSLDPGAPSKVEVVSGTQLRNYGSTFLIPYELRVAPEAVDGANKIEGKLSRERTGVDDVTQIVEFDVEVQKVSTDFEITVQDYDPITGIVTFEIINVGENDVEAVTIDVPKQDNVKISGTNREIIGDMDSGEDTTFRFDTSSITDGQIEMQLRYNDQTGERRTVSENVEYDSSYFAGRAVQSSGAGAWFWIILIIIVLVIVFFVWRSRKKRRERLEKFNKGKR